MKYNFNLNLILSYIWEIFTGVRDIGDIVKYSDISVKFKAAAALIVKLIRMLVILALIFGSYRAAFFYYENFIKVNEQSNLKIKARDDKSLDKDLIAQAEKLLKFRTNGYVIADEMSRMGLNLFESESDNLNDLSKADNKLPEISVKAKILGNNKNKGLIILSVNKSNFKLRAEDTFIFEGKLGRIINIKREHVLINFDGHEIEIK